MKPCFQADFQYLKIIQKYYNFSLCTTCTCSTFEYQNNNNMKNTLEHNTGSFSVTEELRIKLDGQDMLNMGWTLADDESPETEFAITITTPHGELGSRILLEMLVSNDEWVSTANPYDFVFIDAIQDLIRHGYVAENKVAL